MVECVLNAECIVESERQRVSEETSEVRVGGEAKKALGHAATAWPPPAAETTPAKRRQIWQPRSDARTRLITTFKWSRFALTFTSLVLVLVLLLDLYLSTIFGYRTGTCTGTCKKVLVAKTNIFCCNWHALISVLCRCGSKLKCTNVGCVRF